MEEFYNLLSPLARIYYIGIGSAEGSGINDNTLENQQYPDFLHKYPDFLKTIILIDQNLQEPTYLESTQTQPPLEKIILTTIPCYKVIYPSLEIFVLKSNNIINFNWINNDYCVSPFTIDFIQNIISHVLMTNSCLIAESFTGHNLNPIRELFYEISPYNQILYSLYFGADFGCFSKKCFLSNIFIENINGFPRFSNPYEIPNDQLYQHFINETNIDKKLQIGWIVFVNTQKKLLSNSYFIDYIKRQDDINQIVEDSYWTYFKAPSTLKNEILNLYKDSSTRLLSIEMLYRYFDEQYHICVDYLPPDSKSNIVFDLIHNKSYQLVQNLINLLNKIYSFDIYKELNSD